MKRQNNAEFHDVNNVNHQNMCQQCYRNRKLKKRNICMGCFVRNERPYTIQHLCETKYNPCGGISIYGIMPKDGNKLRLHNIIHWEYTLLGEDKYVGLYQDFRPFNNVSSIIEFGNSWLDDNVMRFISTHMKKIQKGLIEHDGNGLSALIETKSGRYYWINGVWG